MLSLSTTAFNDAATCLRRYEYRHRLKLVPKPPNVGIALRRGIWLHAALEEYHKGRNWLERLDAMRDWATEHGVDDDQVEALEREVYGIIAGYIAYWEEHGEKWEIVAVEEPVEIAFPTLGLRLTATLDTVVRRPDGHLYIVEHKSTQSIPDSTWRCIDPQTALQYFVCRASQRYPVEGIVFNYLNTRKAPVPAVTTKGMFAQRDITTTTYAFEQAIPQLAWQSEAYVDEHRQKWVNDHAFYQRHVMFRPDVALRQTFLDVSGVVRDIRAAEQNGHFRRAFNRMICDFCPYAKVCPVEFSLGRVAESTRDEYYMVETPDVRSEGRY
jgi:PD-(D/E)XK nuclease superfamily